MKIRRMIASVLILCSLIPTAVLLGLCVKIFSDRVGRMVRQEIETSARIQAGNVEGILNQGKENLQFIANIPMIGQMAAIAEEGGQESAAYRELQSLCGQLLEARLWDQPFLTEVLVADTHHRILADSGTQNHPQGRSPLPPEVFAKMAESGEWQVSSIQNKKGASVFYFAYPITLDGRIIGYVMSEALTENIRHIVDNGRFSKTSSITVFDSAGNIAATNSPWLQGQASFLDIEKDSLFREQLLNIDFLSNHAGSITYDAGGEERLSYYTYLPGCRWLILCAVSLSEFRAPLYQTLTLTGAFCAILLLLLAVIWSLVSRYFDRPVDRILGAIRKMQEGDENQRVVLDQDNEFGEIGSAFNQLMDKIARDHEELRMNAERYRIISEQSENIVYDVNLSSHRIHFSRHFEEKFGYVPPKDGYPENMHVRGILHPEDVPAFYDTWTSALHGEKGASCAIRFRKADGCFLWCRVQMTMIPDEKGSPVRVVGRIKDVDRELRESELLRNRAQRDALTGLYNKETARILIDEILSGSCPESCHAMFVIDLDNFKNVNDSLGHLHGDEVLRQTARELSGLCRSTDIVSRFGGDEFVMFLRDLPSAAFAEEKAGEICRIFQRDFFQAEDPRCRVSGSVGVAFFPDCGKSFKEMFDKADQALYRVKRNGKNHYQIWREQNDV